MGLDDVTGHTSVRNMAGEILGSVNAVKTVENYSAKTLTIYYDYAGTEMWATGKWTAKNKYTKKYHDFMASSERKIKIYFQKMAEHSSLESSEIADTLAKLACRTNISEKQKKKLMEFQKKEKGKT